MRYEAVGAGGCVLLSALQGIRSRGARGRIPFHSELPIVLAFPRWVKERDASSEIFTSRPQRFQIPLESDLT